MDNPYLARFRSAATMEPQQDPRQLAVQARLNNEQGPHSTGIGSIAGGILGGIAGSFVGPGVGTIAGGALGSAAGEGIEQFLTHGNVNAGDVAREGAIGAVGGVAGKMIGKVGAKVLAKGGQAALEGAQTAGKTASGASSAAAAGVSRSAAAPAKMSFEGQARRMVNQKLLDQYGTLSGPAGRSFDPLETVGRLADRGIEKPLDAERIAGLITGSHGELNKITSAAASKAGRIPIDGLREEAQRLLIQEEVDPTKAKTFMGAFEQSLKKLAGAANGTLKPGADPMDVLESLRHMEGKARDFFGKGNNFRLANADKEPVARVWQQMAANLEDRLYGSVQGADQHLPGLLTPELRQKLVQMHPGNDKWAKWVDENVMNAKSLEDIRGAQKDFVNISKIIQDTDQGYGTFRNKVPAALATLNDLTNAPSITAAAATVGKAALESNVGNRLQAKALRFASGAPAFAGAAGAQVAGQVGAHGAANALSPQEPVQAAQQDMGRLVPADGSESMPPSAGDAYGAQTAPTAGSQRFSPQVVEQMLVDDLKRTGGQNFDRIKALVGIEDSLYPQDSAKTNTNTQKELLKVASARNVADQVAQQFGSLGDTGRLAGAIKGAAGAAGLNAKAKVYEDFRQSALSNIARAVAGETGTMTDSDIARIDGLLPKVTDTSEEAQLKLDNLYQLIAQREQAVNRYGGGGDSLSPGE